MPYTVSKTIKGYKQQHNQPETNCKKLSKVSTKKSTTMHMPTANPGNTFFTKHHQHQLDHTSENNSFKDHHCAVTANVITNNTFQDHTVHKQQTTHTTTSQSTTSTHHLRKSETNHHRTTPAHKETIPTTCVYTVANIHSSNNINTVRSIHQLLAHQTNFLHTSHMYSKQWKVSRP